MAEFLFVRQLLTKMHVPCCSNSFLTMAKKFVCLQSLLRLDRIRLRQKEVGGYQMHLETTLLPWLPLKNSYVKNFVSFLSV